MMKRTWRLAACAVTGSLIGVGLGYTMNAPRMPFHTFETQHNLVASTQGFALSDVMNTGNSQANHLDVVVHGASAPVLNTDSLDAIGRIYDKAGNDIRPLLSGNVVIDAEVDNAFQRVLANAALEKIDGAIKACTMEWSMLPDAVGQPRVSMKAMRSCDLAILKNTMATEVSHEGELLAEGASFDSPDLPNFTNVFVLTVPQRTGDPLQITTICSVVRAIPSRCRLQL